MIYLVYVLPLVLVLAWHLRKRENLQAESIVAKVEAEEAGLTEPASLHPLIDPLKCIGCGSCVLACPEQGHHTVLGLINGKAALVSPTECIGHGACRSACPVDAIELVLGTEKRGVDIPRVSPWFETNVPGIFVAGELGGMGLIRNAIEQGRQAIDEIAKRRPKGIAPLDVLIVGAGPSGFSACLGAKSKGLNYIAIEQESLGGCVFQYPRGKLVMTQPAMLPLVGKFKFTTAQKEQLLETWTKIEADHQLNIRYYESVTSIVPEGKGFKVTTTRGEYTAGTVLLAIGRRGTPRKLGVPGEELPKVVYRLIDPQQYKGHKVIVVGGGDSALEAAASIAEEGGEVILSYRGEAFQRAKPRNRDRVQKAQEGGRLQVMLNSQIKAITSDKAQLSVSGVMVEVDNDDIIVNAGGILPTDFLKRVGIDVDTKYGTT
jgi:thioredoxin reductase/NAD-dependent dihydropyrimidine dehydrogenase PreA subunit